jgi:hypothetical protein
VNNTKRSILAATALALCAAARTPGVRPVPETVVERSWTAITESVPSYLAAREVRLNLDFPSGKTGKASLLILFHPTTGLFAERLGAWGNPDGSDSHQIYGSNAWCPFGVGDGRLVQVAMGQFGLQIAESTDKASSLDEAESKSLQSIRDHLVEIEARSWFPERAGLSGFRLEVDDYPHGFFEPCIELHTYPCDATLGLQLPVGVSAMTWRDGGWDLTLECPRTKRKATMQINRQGGKWTRGPILPVDEEKKRE